jgi:hypothetical protein
LFKFRAEWLQQGASGARDATAQADRTAHLNALTDRATIMRDANPLQETDSVRVFDGQGTALGTFRV